MRTPFLAVEHADKAGIVKIFAEGFLVNRGSLADCPCNKILDYCLAAQRIDPVNDLIGDVFINKAVVLDDSLERCAYFGIVQLIAAHREVVAAHNHIL